MPASHRILIVEARSLRGHADALARGAIGALEAAGYVADRIAVPGALEIPAAIANGGARGEDGIRSMKYDGFVAFGAVSSGARPATTNRLKRKRPEGCSSLPLISILPSAPMRILTPSENGDQAWERADPGRKNKGGEAAEACLAMIDLRRRFVLSG